MKYVLLLCDTEETDRRTPAEAGEYYGRIMTWWQEHTQAGRLIAGEKLQGVSTATTVRHTKDGPLITDGPFLEAKESVGGFAVVDVPDLDAALAMAKTFPWGGTVEVRPVDDTAGGTMDGDPGAQ